MKLYRISATQDAEVKEVVWVGSQSDAAKARKDMVGQGFKRAAIETEEVDIDTKKDGLLAFLNERRA